VKEKLSKVQLLELLDKIMQPKVYGLSEKEGDDVLLAFCAGCPDPVKARWLIVECLDPMTDEELVDRALAMPLRHMVDVPLSELPDGHALRVMDA
jgi:hypothetical protein